MSEFCSPGDLFLTQITGPSGWLIRLGQALMGDWSRYCHAGIVLDDGTVVSAQPGGARIQPLDYILGQRTVAFTHYDVPLPTRAEIVALARSLEGTPYSFLDYLSLALLRLGIRPKWLLNYVENSGHMICSQFVDFVAAHCGVHLFADGRAHGDVSPGDIAHVGLILHLPGPRIA